MKRPTRKPLKMTTSGPWAYAAGLALLITMGLSATGQAQNRFQRSQALQQIHSENHQISLVPVPLFFNGFRIDYDARIKDNLWLNVAPQFNYRRKAERPARHYSKRNVHPTNEGGYENLPVYTLNQTGFSLEVNLRYYQPNTSRSELTSGLYYAAGIGLEYNQCDRLNSTDTPYAVNTTRLGTQVQIGYMLRLWPRATFDIYLGGAWRYALNQFTNPADEAVMKLDAQHSWTYQYSGIFLEAGIRIGFML